MPLGKMMQNAVKNRCLVSQLAVSGEYSLTPKQRIY
jgi:hypothetical protein